MQLPRIAIKLKWWHKSYEGHDSWIIVASSRPELDLPLSCWASEFVALSYKSGIIVLNLIMESSPNYINWIPFEVIIIFLLQTMWNGIPFVVLWFKCETWLNSRALLGKFPSYSTLLEYFNRMLVDDGPQNKKNSFPLGLYFVNILSLFSFSLEGHKEVIINVRKSLAFDINRIN